MNPPLKPARKRRERVSGDTSRVKPKSEPGATKTKAVYMKALESRGSVVECAAREPRFRWHD
jgi:hypothetical protein